MAVRVFKAIDRARGLVDAINMVVGVARILESGQFEPWLKNSGGLIGSGFSAGEAAESMKRNLPTIFRLTVPSWSLWLARHGAKLASLTVYLPNPGSLPQVSIKTGLKIGRLPVSLLAGGKSKYGSIFGIGFQAPGIKGWDQYQQMWRIDYHSVHRPKGGAIRLKENEISAWEDHPFHYHVMKPRF